MIDALVIGPAKAGMSCRLHPLVHLCGELLGRHAGVGQAKDVEQSLLVIGEQFWGVPVQRGLDEKIILPLWLGWELLPQAVKSERQLKRDRVLRPQGAVIVERRNALSGWNEVRRAYRCHLLDKRWPASKPHHSTMATGPGPEPGWLGPEPG
jgi:hypothetical protein